MNGPNGGAAAAIQILEARGWFAARSKQVQEKLAAIARLRHFDAGEAVYLVGDQPNGVFGLVSGALNVSFPRSDGEDYVMHRASAGFWVGDLALLSDRKRLVSIYAAGPTVLFHLPAPELAKLLADDPTLYADFYALTYENFHTACRVISNLSMASVEKRIADRLLLEAAATSDGDGWIALSQPDLANLVALSLPTLQRAIARFARRGLIERGYGRIRVIDGGTLKRLCGA